MKYKRRYEKKDTRKNKKNKIPEKDTRKKIKYQKKNKKINFSSIALVNGLTFI